MSVAVRNIDVEERPRVEQLLVERWGSTKVVSRDRVIDAAEAEALVAVREGEIVGVATYVVSDGEAELVTLDALEEGVGVGGALVEAVATAAKAGGARRLVLSTTNDNLRALALYQRRGFRLVALRPGAVERARREKPSIPLVGSSGIPVRDELDLVRDLDDIPEREREREPGPGPGPETDAETKEG